MSAKSVYKNLSQKNGKKKEMMVLPKKVVSVRLDKQVVFKIEAYANSHGVRVADVVRIAIEEMFSIVNGKHRNADEAIADVFELAEKQQKMLRQTLKSTLVLETVLKQNNQESFTLAQEKVENILKSRGY
jgi:hypothetical protein